MEALVQLATAAFRPDLRAATQFHCHLFHAGSDAWGEPAGARTWDRHRAPGYWSGTTSLDKRSALLDKRDQLSKILIYFTLIRYTLKEYPVHQEPLREKTAMSNFIERLYTWDESAVCYKTPLKRASGFAVLSPGAMSMVGFPHLRIANGMARTGCWSRSLTWTIRQEMRRCYLSENRSTSGFSQIHGCVLSSTTPLQGEYACVLPWKAMPSLLF